MDAIILLKCCSLGVKQQSQNVLVLRFPIPMFSMTESLVRIILITCVTSQRCKIKSCSTFPLSSDNNVLKQKTKTITQNRTNFKIKYRCRRKRQNRYYQHTNYVIITIERQIHCSQTVILVSTSISNRTFWTCTSSVYALKVTKNKNANS
jgi:hypothetical protein